jgi:hypothetical protein
MKKLNQSGSHIIAMVLGLLVVGVVGFAGYRVYSSQKNDKTSPKSENKTSSTDKKAEKKWTDGEFAVKGTWADADVVKISDKQWRMYYAVQPEVQGHKFEIYSATSSDGKTWEKEAGTRKTMATFPDVVKTNDGKWRMYFQSAGELKSAISTDGLVFTDEAGTRIDKTNDEGLTFDNVAAPTTYLNEDGSYMMVYRGTINSRYAADTPNATTQLLMWATSSDGLTWDKKGIAVDSRNTTLRGQLDGPDIIKWDDGKLHVFATNYEGVFEFIFDGSKFDSGTKAFALAASQPTQTAPGSSPTPPKVSAPPGDPTLAKVGDTWFMYYGIAFADGGIMYATY